jgi:hypothetical protein
LYVNTGDWLKYQTFAQFDNKQLTLLQWVDNKVLPYNAK